MNKFPLYFNCHLFYPLGTDVIFKFKIDTSNLPAHPYQLFRRKIDGWQNLSVYASIKDALMILLKELFSVQLADEINHGQATIDVEKILNKIEDGMRIISISVANKNILRDRFDIAFEDLVKKH